MNKLFTAIILCLISITFSICNVANAAWPKSHKPKQPHHKKFIYSFVIPNYSQSDENFNRDDMVTRL